MTGVTTARPLLSMNYFKPDCQPGRTAVFIKSKVKGAAALAIDFNDSRVIFGMCSEFINSSHQCENLA